MGKHKENMSMLNHLNYVTEVTWFFLLLPSGPGTRWVALDTASSESGGMEFLGRH